MFWTFSIFQSITFGLQRLPPTSALEDAPHLREISAWKSEDQPTLEELKFHVKESLCHRFWVHILGSFGGESPFQGSRNENGVLPFLGRDLEALSTGKNCTLRDRSSRIRQTFIQAKRDVVMMC